MNWFDTAATYGAGQSEENLGRTLAELNVADRVHVATKVRVMPEQLDCIGQTVRQSVEQSLRRLRLKRITLLQVHNSITMVAVPSRHRFRPSTYWAPTACCRKCCG